MVYNSESGPTSLQTEFESAHVTISPLCQKPVTHIIVLNLHIISGILFQNFSYTNTHNITSIIAQASFH